MMISSPCFTARCQWRNQLSVFVQTVSKLVDSSETIVYGNNVVQNGNKFGNKSLHLEMSILYDVGDTAHSVG